MLGSLLNIKKKLNDNQLANVFLNGILDLVDSSFAEIADLINEDAVFVQAPNIDRNDNTEFTMIILVANISKIYYIDWYPDNCAKTAYAFLLSL